MTADSPQFSTLSRNDPRIGIALGSGSARGWAHIGVLRALEEIGIYPGVVAGSSIGALVGGAYASNHLDSLESWVTTLTRKDILAFMDVSFLEGGIIKGEKLMAFASTCMSGLEIQSLPISFAAVATELQTGREAWLRKGDLLKSIRASIALPGVFSPIKLDGRWLVDGGLVDPVPISLCRAMGAEVVIAVNLNGDIVGKRNNHKSPENETHKQRSVDDSDERSGLTSQLTSSFRQKKDRFLTRLVGESKDTPGLYDVMASSLNIMQDLITRSRMAGNPPDLILAPRLSRLGLMEFDKAAVAIEEGHACVARMRPVLDEMLTQL